VLTIVPAPAATVAPQAAAGRGSVEIVRRGSRSVVRRAFAVSPLRLLTPANHGSAAWVYTSSLGGGLVDGDSIVLDVRVGAGAAVYLSSQSSTKVYRSPRGTTAAMSGVVEAGGLLVAAPDPVVPFAGARYRQLQRFDVAADGGLVVVDALASGRRASGERWQFADYESRLEVMVDGRLRVYDPVALRAADGELARRFGRFNALAVAVLAGGALRSEIARVLQLAEPTGRHAREAEPHQRGDMPLDIETRQIRRVDLVTAVSRLGEDACLVRVAGVSNEAVGRRLRELLQFVPVRLGDNPWTRKW
jgi:urease accessory protein